MKNYLLVIFIILTASCSGIEFVYSDKENLLNPLYGKTYIKTSGKEITYLDSFGRKFFGNNKNKNFNLLINVEEKKTKRFVETNQTASNLRYELRFYYTLLSNDKDCVVYEKEILSYFSIVPKSSGYNYGTDISLEKKYELAVSENINQFISFLSKKNIKTCA